MSGAQNPLAPLRWTRLGRVFDPEACRVPGWRSTFAQSPAAVVFDSHVRVFFCSRVADADGMSRSSIMRLDLDRADLRRVLAVHPEPVLPLGGRGCFDEFGANPVSAVLHGGELRLYYAGWTRCESVPFQAAIGVAVSRDGGESFSRLGPGPVLANDPDDAYVIGSPRVRRFGGRWHLWYSSGRKWVRTGGRPEPVYKLRMAVSEDGLEWERCGRDLLPSVLEEDECQASGEVFELGGRYHMLFSHRCNLDFRAAGRGYRLGYASSTDLLNWRREDEKAGLLAAEAGWDSESVSYPNIFSVDGRWYMLYQGNGIGQAGFGLAQLDEPQAGGPL